MKILKIWVADFRAGTPPRSGGQKIFLQTTKVFQAARPSNPRIKEGLEKETEPGGQKNPCRLKREKTELVPKVKRNQSKLQDLRSGIFMPPCRRTPD